MSDRTNTSTAPGWYPDPAGGPQTRWWDGDQWTDQVGPPVHQPPLVQPFAPPKRKKRIWLRVLLGLVVLSLLGIGGCVTVVVAFANKASNDNQKAKVAATNEVKLGSCETSVVGYKAGGTLQNGSSKRSTYFIDVSFLAANGTQLDTSSTVVDNVDPGQTANWQAVALAGSPDPTVTCKVTSVDRMASTNSP